MFKFWIVVEVIILQQLENDFYSPCVLSKIKDWLVQLLKANETLTVTITAQCLQDCH